MRRDVANGSGDRWSPSRVGESIRSGKPRRQFLDVLARDEACHPFEDEGAEPFELKRRTINNRLVKNPTSESQDNSMPRRSAWAICLIIALTCTPTDTLQATGQARRRMLPLAGEVGMRDHQPTVGIRAKNGQTRRTPCHRCAVDRLVDHDPVADYQEVARRGRDHILEPPSERPCDRGQLASEVALAVIADTVGALDLKFRCQDASTASTSAETTASANAVTAWRAASMVASSSPAALKVMIPPTTAMATMNRSRMATPFQNRDYDRDFPYVRLLKASVALSDG
jgi:hypothetical protein